MTPSLLPTLLLITAFTSAAFAQSTPHQHDHHGRRWGGDVPAEAFAKFSCEGHGRRDDFRVQTLRYERMSSANRSTRSGVTTHGRRAALVAAPFGLVFLAAVSVAEPPVTVEYQSSFAGYRRFDAEVPMVAWWQANDAIGRRGEGAAHGTHGMDSPAEPASADTTESKPTTSGEHREHRQ